jgi:DNA-binding CsgD family transcriptional regulator
MGTSRRTRRGRPGQGDPLTPRELEVLALVAAGERTAVIAARLGIAEDTVKSHCTSAYKKIGARNRVDAARYYLAYGAPAPIAPGAGDLDQQIAALQARLDILSPSAEEAARVRHALDALRGAHTPESAPDRSP